MHLLAISTSTSAWSVWLHRQDGWERAVRAEAGRGTGQRASLTAMVWALLADGGLQPQELQRVVCDVGPGSFTGLRQGLALARALAWAHQIPTQAAGSLQAMAQQAGAMVGDGQTLAVALPARSDVDFVGVRRAGVWTERALTTTEAQLWWDDVRPDVIGVPQSDMQRALATAARARDISVVVLQPDAETMGRWSLVQPNAQDSLHPRYLAVSEAEHHAGVAMPDATLPSINRN